MKWVTIPSVVLGSALAFLATGATRLNAATEEGVALAIVYDTSGSMSDPVRDSTGHHAPKYKIANRALESIARQIQAYASRPGESGPRKIEVGLFTFDGSGTKTVVPLGKFDPEPITSWAHRFSSPGSGTPLGAALRDASHAVLKSDLSQKHVLLITDGINTVGPDPAKTLPPILKEAEQKQVKLGVYFVAFDVDAKVFNSVKKQGAKVFSASDEKQLGSQLQYILQKEILLEEPEKPQKN
jgi:hypothetical protein